MSSTSAREVRVDSLKVGQRFRCRNGSIWTLVRQHSANSVAYVARTYEGTEVCFTGCGFVEPIGDTLLTPTGYLSARTNAAGKRVWTVLRHNQPLCADNESLKDVLAVAQQHFGRVVLAVWDGDKGEFTSELLADPNY